MLTPSSEYPKPARSRHCRPLVMRAGTFDLPAFTAAFSEDADGGRDLPVSSASASQCRDLERDLRELRHEFDVAARRMQREIDGRLTALENEPLPLAVAS